MPHRWDESTRWGKEGTKPPLCTTKKSVCNFKSVLSSQNFRLVQVWELYYQGQFFTISGRSLRSVEGLFGFCCGRVDGPCQSKLSDVSLRQARPSTNECVYTKDARCSERSRSGEKREVPVTSLPSSDLSEDQCSSHKRAIRVLDAIGLNCFRTSMWSLENGACSSPRLIISKLLHLQTTS